MNKKILYLFLFTILIIGSLMGCSENINAIPFKEGYSSVNLSKYSEKYDPYKDISEYYKPCTFTNSLLSEKIIEYKYNGNTILVGETETGDVFMAVGNDEYGMNDVFFWIDEYIYPTDNIKIAEYKNVLRHDGIIFSFPEGADSNNIIYLYWEDNSFQPIPLALCNKSNYEVDINGDGINDLISSHHYMAQIIYLCDNELYTAEIGDILRKELNIDGLMGQYDVESNKFEFYANGNTTKIECFIENNILYYKQNTDGTENIVVQNPKYNQVTNEIDEKLVGKYIVEDDPEMYFEIKPDGSVEMSINAMSGYAKYYGGIGVTAFYQYSEEYDLYRITLSFTLLSGEHTFPGSYLSFDFISDGDTGYDVFMLLTYLYGVEFVKTIN